MASPISPEEGKNSKEAVAEALHGPRNERVHIPTDEQYPTGTKYEKNSVSAILKKPRKCNNTKCNEKIYKGAQVSYTGKRMSERRITS